MKAARATTLVIATLVVAGCGSGSSSTAEQITSESTVETTTAPVATTPAKPKSKPSVRRIVIVVDQGRPRGGIKRPKLERGEKVVLVVRADVGEEIHVHGYELTRAVTPGRAARIPITARLAGRFEVELHHPDALLAVLEVRP